MFGGGYGGYEVCLILLIVGILVNYDGGWSYGLGIGAAVVIAYLVEAGVSAFCSFWFYPSWLKWYK